MKAILFALLALTISTEGLARSHSVHGYRTKRGTYVAPHRKTYSDHSKSNNWSSKGNVNPYTGKRGTK